MSQKIKQNASLPNHNWFEGSAGNHESLPLLMKVASMESFADKRRSASEWEQARLMASIFLTDFERARPPTLPPMNEVTKSTLFIHRLRYSTLCEVSKVFAVCALFLASCLEGENCITLPFSLNFFATLVLLGDFFLQRQLRVSNCSWTLPTVLMLTVLVTEMLFLICFPQSRGRMMISSIAKPIVLFNYSLKARQAFEAVLRISHIISRVIALELLLTLSFAAVACRLFNRFDSFRNLAISWVSLFQCASSWILLLSLVLNSSQYQ